jgi:hypothetical protein
MLLTNLRVRLLPVFCSRGGGKGGADIEKVQSFLLGGGSNDYLLQEGA